MSRERDFYRKMEQDARNSMYEPEIIDVSPPAKKVKTNYLSAVVWTSVVATVVCTIFMGLLLYVVNESRIEERLEQAASHALYNLESVIKQQNLATSATPSWRTRNGTWRQWCSPRSPGS